jgi:SAM-dependent methyltransferase
MISNSWLSSESDEKEKAFSFTRDKRGLFIWRILYFLRRILALGLGETRVTKLLLMINWYTNRLAFESIQKLTNENKDISVIGATKEFLRENVSSGSKVLDLGCSTGHWSFLAAQMGAQVVGIDLNPHAIDKAKSMNSSVSFLNMSVEDFISENSEFYDLAILTHIIEHLDFPESILMLLKSRVEKLIIEVPDIESSALNFARIRMGLPFYTDPDHVREYSLETLELLLAQTGWQIKECVKRGGTIAVLADSSEG